MFRVLSARKSFIVTCRQCSRLVATGQGEFPFRSVWVECRFCGARHSYRPSEISHGRAEEHVAQGASRQPHSLAALAQTNMTAGLGGAARAAGFARTQTHHAQ